MQRLLLIHQDPGMLTSLKDLFGEKECTDLVIDEVNSGEDALKKVAGTPYDLLLLSLTIPNTDMLGLIKRLKHIHPELPILTYSLSLEYIFIKRYLTSGVNGYCFYKSHEPEEILKACQTIFSGRWYISPEMIELIVENALYNKKADRFDSLNEREFEVFTHLVKDQTPADIAQILSVHTSTIALYKARIMDKLRITNLLEMKKMVRTPSIA